MKKAENIKIRNRILLLGVLFSIFFAVIAARAVYLQLFQGQWLLQKAEGQYKRHLVEIGKRGTIYDSMGREMAVSMDNKSLAVRPGLIKNPRRYARLLSRVLGMRQKSIMKVLRSGKQFEWIKRNLSQKKAAAIANMKLTGLELVNEHGRFYPNIELAAQVIGISGIDGQGLEGLEFSYNNILKGDSSRRTILRDACGRGFESKNSEAPPSVNGKSIVITIDHTIQYIAEKALAEAVESSKAKSGMAVVMSPETGAVLAMANYPGFDPNCYTKYDRSLWRNRIITDRFEPGSTMKIFLAAAAIDSGYCTSNTIFFCEGGSYRIQNIVIHDTHSHGWLSLQQIVKFSSNIGSMKVAQMIGGDTLYSTLNNLGFGKITGIDYPGETRGHLTRPSRWTRIDLGSISFGQGISVSAIQLITAVSAIANDGILMRPYLVKSILENDGTIADKFSPRMAKRAMSKATARTMKRIMKSVVTKGGTGVNAAMRGYSVCGKTGTAQKIDDTGKYSKDNYIASFIGFAPADKPAAAILVVIDSPGGKHYGGVVAAPAFKKIALETLHYMNIPPQRQPIDFNPRRVALMMEKEGER